MRDRKRGRALRLTCAAAMGCLALAASRTADARRLVEAGDLLVGAGDTVWVVRADGRGVAPFSPRPGGSANQLSLPAGIGVDAVRERVLVADFGGGLFVIDPEDGSQTRVVDILGGPLPLGDRLNGLEVLSDGSVLVGSIEVSSFPIESYSARIDLVTAPNTQARAVATPRSEQLFSTLFPIQVGLAASEPIPGSPVILASVFLFGGSMLATVGMDGTVTPADGIPTQAGALVTEADVLCSSSGLLLFCVRYWSELRTVANECIPSDATIVRDNLFSVKEIYSGPPLRCPFSVEVAPGGEQVFVLDGNSDGSDLRVYRLDRDAATDTYTAVRIADESQLPSSAFPAVPGLTIAPVALPEPAAGGAAAALGALALRATRRRRLAARRCTRDGGAARRPPPAVRDRRRHPTHARHPGGGRLARPGHHGLLAGGMQGMRGRMRRRVPCLVGAATMGWLALAAPRAAEARRLVEAGDLLVGAGDTVWVVRADGGGVAPFSPRPGSGANQLTRPTGVGVDAARERVLVADVSGALFVVDPADGSQTRVVDILGGPLPLGERSTGLEVLSDGSVLVGSIEPIDIPQYHEARVDLVSAPSARARALAGRRSDPIGGAHLAVLGVEMGLAAAEPNPGSPTILATISAAGTSQLAFIAMDGAVYFADEAPLQDGYTIVDPDVDCPSGVSCQFYWTEMIPETPDCSGGSIVRFTLFGPQVIYGGAPLRCPVEVEVVSGGDRVFVVDARADGSDLRVYRLDRDPETDTFAPMPIADESALPDGGSLHGPALAISPVALPEPVTGGEAAALGALAGWTARRRRAAARGCGRDGAAARRPRPSR